MATAIGAREDSAAETGRHSSVGPLIDRPRLLQRLTLATAPLVVLHAPAGYGKTALLNQWDNADTREFTWLTLDRPGADAAALADEVRCQLARRVRRRVLVLDGAQALADPTLLPFVADIAECQEPDATIAVATRGEPEIPLGTLRVRTAVVELDQHELALTTPEAEAMLGSAGLTLAPHELEALCLRVGGWPAGLRLAALALHGQPDAGVALAGFGGDDRVVGDYLRETILEELPEAERIFLRRVAPLGELSGPLCDAVLEREGSAELLRALARAEQLVVAADRSERTFRLHPMLAGALSAELDRSEPGVACGLHRRASAWHESEGDLPRALDHAIAARDSVRAGDLLWQLARGYSTRGRRRELWSWLERVGDADAQREPGLALAAAVERRAAGDRDGAERWADAAELALDAAEGALEATGHAALAVIRASLVRGDARRLLADAQRARGAAGSGEWRGQACLLEGVAHRLLGERTAARRALAMAARGDGSESTTVRALALALVALIELERDDVEAALASAEAALDGADAIDLGNDPTAALVYAAAACARAQAGAIEQARDDVDRSRRLLLALPDPAPWYAAETSIALACALLRLSDSAEARELLAVATRRVRDLPDAAGLQAWLDAAWNRADSFTIDAMAGPSALTIAELRVLRFLPSHLSFREIAGKLHVSANTVKTQAHAVYRKLDASSRSEAVDRAVAIGLVDT